MATDIGRAGKLTLRAPCRFARGATRSPAVLTHGMAGALMLAAQRVAAGITTLEFWLPKHATAGA